jgi:FkbM family methyltransferase
VRLFPYDAYTSLTRVFGASEAIAVIDVGANEGQTVARVRKEFPKATIHAFEPAPDTFRRLQAATAGDSGVHVYQIACGSASGLADFHLTGNHWCSSLLAPSDLGKRYYGDWYDTRDVVQVRVQTLDEWAAEHGISRIDLLKVDAQGFDLEVLRGARGLLKHVRAINCECQFAPEYDGCASFSQIDRFLVENGFALHQLHEVNDRGDEEQTTYGDGLWLRVDVLAQLRSRTDLPDLSPKGRVRSALRKAKAQGATRAALYGSGRHTQGLAPFFDDFSLPIVAILDDDHRSHGAIVGGRRVISPASAGALGVDVVVLSSDAHEPSLWRSGAPLRAAGIPIIPLYTPHLLVEHRETVTTA